MKSIKKILYSLLVIFFFNIVLIKNVYADMVSFQTEIINYSPLYYIAIIVIIAIVVGISILILRKIYKSNQLEKNTENERGSEKNDRFTSQ